MGYIKVNQSKITPQIVKDLIKLCPFQAFNYDDDKLTINAGCKVCKICVKKGPKGVCELVEDNVKTIDKSKYNGIAVFIEIHDEKIHPVSFELIGKAKELAKIRNEMVYAIIINDKDKLNEFAHTVYKYGVDKIYGYIANQNQISDYQYIAKFFEVFQKEVSANVILFGGTLYGRSLAPRVASKLKTGLTADCTSLYMSENGDLLQVRPAFGGNIMAKITTPMHRPQLATIRYKMFDAPLENDNVDKHPIINDVLVKDDRKMELVKKIVNKTDEDISEADIIIAVGRAFRKKEDLALINPLVKKLNAKIACTRPLVENGWFDAKKQIGLSGRTVKPKLIISIGISGAIQYIEGMKGSELIISINTDKDNALFKISDIAIVADLYQLLPKLNELL